MMWEAARDKVVAGGNEVRMGTSLHQMSWNAIEGLWRVDRGRPNGDARHDRGAREVISSAPDARARRPHPSAAGLRVPRRSTSNIATFMTVALKIRAPDLFPDNWIYIHDPKVRVGRIQNFRSWSPEMVPDPALACVGLEYFCFEGDGLWATSDDDLIALATREMAALGLCDPAAVDRRRRGAPGKGVSGLRRALSRQRRGDARARTRGELSRRCTSSAATACTATTTRITR